MGGEWGLGFQISRKSYNLLKCSCKTRVQAKEWQILAPILNVHWLHSKNCDPPWNKELLTVIYFEHVTANFLSTFYLVLPKQLNRKLFFGLQFLNYLLSKHYHFFDQSQQPKYFKHDSLIREVKVARNSQWLCCWNLCLIKFNKLILSRALHFLKNHYSLHQKSG